MGKTDTNTNVNTNTKANVIAPATPGKKGKWGHTLAATCEACLKSGDSTFTASNGDTFTIHMQDFFKELWGKMGNIQKMLAFNGMAQKVVDKTAGKKDHERIQLMADTYNLLKSGQWNAGRLGMSEEQKQLNSAIRTLADKEKAGELTEEEKKALAIVRNITKSK